MQIENLIALDEFCVKHEIEISFIDSLQQNGLIEITMIENAWFIDSDQLLQLEKFVRFYYELDINLEGIETISHLLECVNALQDELTMLKNRLGIYE
ncbi:MAG TPA: chaperone modulator CbpM [Paludibacter sp.]